MPIYVHFTYAVELTAMRNSVIMGHVLQSGSQRERQCRMAVDISMISLGGVCILCLLGV